MKRLDFTLPDFTRIIWVNGRARKTWQPILKRITNAWLEIEWLSIVEGIRPCSLTAVTPEQLIQKGGQWAEHGLNNLPLAIQGISNYSYSNTSTEVEPGKPFAFRIVVGKPHHVIEFKRAWDTDDDKSIAKLLGYPDCCMDFYRESWVKHGLIDTTWPMANGKFDTLRGADPSRSQRTSRGEYSLAMDGSQGSASSALQFQM